MDGETEAALPAAFIWDGVELHTWIDAQEMDSYQTLEALMAEVVQRVREKQV